MTHRNPEKLDPSLWEAAGLRPLTQREIREGYQFNEWKMYSPSVKGWVKCPFGLRGLTICIPASLPRLEQANATTQSLKVMLLEAKLAKAEARVEELECPWQPIETGPRDGTLVLYLSPPRDTWVGNHPPDRFRGKWSYDEKRKLWCGGSLTTLKAEPTHWMPIPPNPPAP